jgi:predicted RNA binding protein YcfA (HicA-like mRNA interferase family)
MPKIPRDISAKDLCGILEKYGYHKTRQTGSHIRLTNLSMGKAHHLTIPDHNPIKIGTLNHILNDVAEYLKINKYNIIKQTKKQ